MSAHVRAWCVRMCTCAHVTCALQGPSNPARPEQSWQFSRTVLAVLPNSPGQSSPIVLAVLPNSPGNPPHEGYEGHQGYEGHEGHQEFEKEDKHKQQYHEADEDHECHEIKKEKQMLMVTACLHDIMGIELGSHETARRFAKECKLYFK